MSSSNSTPIDNEIAALKERIVELNNMREKDATFVYIVHEAHQTWRAVLPNAYKTKESAIAAAYNKWSDRFEGSIVTVPGEARDIIWQHAVNSGLSTGKKTTTIRPDKENIFQIHQLEVSE